MDRDRTGHQTLRLGMCSQTTVGRLLSKGISVGLRFHFGAAGTALGPRAPKHKYRGPLTRRRISWPGFAFPEETWAASQQSPEKSRAEAGGAAANRGAGVPRSAGGAAPPPLD